MHNNSHDFDEKVGVPPLLIESRVQAHVLQIAQVGYVSTDTFTRPGKNGCQL